MKRLQNFYDVRCNKRAQFSPSALNTYMDCQLKFYYTYVAKLKPKPEVSSEIDSAMSYFIVVTQVHSFCFRTP